MKNYTMLLACSCCFAAERHEPTTPPNTPDTSGKSVHVSNVITLTANTHPVYQKRPGPKHPDVIKAHEQLRREQEENDAVTCCCFFKIRKRI